MERGQSVPVPGSWQQLCFWAAPESGKVIPYGGESEAILAPALNFLRLFRGGWSCCCCFSPTAILMLAALGFLTWSSAASGSR